MTLLDAAQEMKHVFPAMFEFVEGRTLAARQNVGNAPPLPPVPAPIPNGTPISLDQIKAEWPSITAARVVRGRGKCTLLDVESVLFSISRNCNHKYSGDAIRHFLTVRLNDGPFPIKCPGCSAETASTASADRGLVTRSILKGLANANVINVITAQRILLQQVNHVANEAEIDFHYSLSKLATDATILNRVGDVLDATVTSVTHAYTSTLLMKAGKDAGWGAVQIATRIATVLLATSASAVAHAALVMALAGRA
eukprot:gene2725-3315_t